MQATMAPTQIISVSSLVSSFIGFLLGLSDNVGPCQALLSALLYALKEERHFALLDGVAFPNRRLARNPFRSGHSVRPMHLFGHNRDHDY